MGGGLTCGDRWCALRGCGDTTCADPTSAWGRAVRTAPVATAEGWRPHLRCPGVCAAGVRGHDLRRPNVRMGRRAPWCERPHSGWPLCSGAGGARPGSAPLQRPKVQRPRVCCGQIQFPHLCSIRRFRGRAFAVGSSGFRTSAESRFGRRAFAVGSSGSRTSAASEGSEAARLLWAAPVSALLNRPHVHSAPPRAPTILTAHALGPAVCSGVRTFRFSKRAAKSHARF